MIWNLFRIADENRLTVIIIIISRIYHNIIRGFLGMLSGSPQGPPQNGGRRLRLSLDVWRPATERRSSRSYFC